MFLKKRLTVWALAIGLGLVLGIGGPVWAQEQGQGWQGGQGGGRDQAVQQAFDAWMNVYERRIGIYQQGLAILDQRLKALESDGQLQDPERLDKVRQILKQKDQLLERIGELRREVYEIRRDRAPGAETARGAGFPAQGQGALPQGPGGAWMQPRQDVQFQHPNEGAPSTSWQPAGQPNPNMGPNAGTAAGPNMGPNFGPNFGPAGPNAGFEGGFRGPTHEEWNAPYPGQRFHHEREHGDLLGRIRSHIHGWLRRHLHGHEGGPHHGPRFQGRDERESGRSRVEIRVERRDEGRGDPNEFAPYAPPVPPAPPAPPPFPGAGRFLIHVPSLLSSPGFLTAGPAFQAGDDEDEDLFDEDFQVDFGEDDGDDSGDAKSGDDDDDLFDEEWQDVEQGLGEWTPPESHGPLDMLRKSERVQELQRELQQRVQRWLMKNPDKLQKLMQLAQRAQKEAEGFQRWVVQPAREGDYDRAARNASRRALELAREFRPEWLPKEVLHKAEELRRGVFHEEEGDWEPSPEEKKDDVFVHDTYVKLRDKALTPEQVERVEWVTDKLMEMTDALDEGDLDTALAAGKELSDRSVEWGAEAWEETLNAGGLYEVYQDALEQQGHALEDIRREIRDSKLEDAIRQLRGLVERGLDGENMNEFRRELLRERVLRDAGRKARRLRMILKQHLEDTGHEVPRSTAKLREVFEQLFPEFDQELKRLLPELFEQDTPKPSGKDKDDDQDQDM